MKKIIIIFSLLLIASPALASFDKDLYYGIENDSDVTALQGFLTSEGLYSGPITGNFYSLTLKAVKSFQEREGITPLAGYFGPVTRSRVNSLLSAQANTPASGIGSTPSPAPVSKTSDDVVSKLQEQLAVLLQQVNLLKQEANLQRAVSFFDYKGIKY